MLNGYNIYSLCCQDSIVLCLVIGIYLAFLHSEYLIGALCIASSPLISAASSRNLLTRLLAIHRLLVIIRKLIELEA
jgi:hypothetical protein